LCGWRGRKKGKPRREKETIKRRPVLLERNQQQRENKNWVGDWGGSSSGTGGRNRTHKKVGKVGSARVGEIWEGLRKTGVGELTGDAN